MLKELALEERPRAQHPDPPVPLANSFSALQAALPGVLLVLVCLLPYLNKAYTIDDPIFLLSARQILHHPLQPMSFIRCWEPAEPCGLNVAKLGAGAAQSLMGYLMVPVVLAGGAEWLAHLIQVLLACLAVIEMVRLASRLGFDRLQSAAAGLLLAAMPPFLLATNTIMPDTAALALGLTGFERLLAWKDERHWQQAAMAALFLGLAPYARPHLILLLPLAALWLLDGLRIRTALAQLQRQAYLWIPILLAATLLATLILITRDRSNVQQSVNLLVSSSHIPRNVFSYLIYLTFPIPFALVWLAAHAKSAPLLLIGPAIPLLCGHYLLSAQGPLTDVWPVAAALHGLVALVHMLYRAARTWDRESILLGLWMLIPAPIIIYDHLPIKYLLVLLPPVIVIMLRNLASLPRKQALAVYGTLALAGAVYSGFVLRADADFGDHARRAAAELIAPHVAAGEKVYFGGIAGFYWYAPEAGAKVAKPGEPGPLLGELLAIAIREGGAITRDRFPKRRLVDSRHYAALHGRTESNGAGLYNNADGNAIWVADPSTTDDYELWRIE